MNVLLLALDLRRWKNAKRSSYTSFVSAGFARGFTANGVNATVCPSPLCWAVKDLVAGIKFHQVWMELPHQTQRFACYGSEFIKSLQNIAPVRVALIGESLHYPEITPDNEAWELCRGHYPAVMDNISSFTHAVCADECDAEEITAKTGVRAVWGPACISEQYAVERPAAGSDSLVFCGGAHNIRRDLARDLAGRVPFRFITNTEAWTAYPLLYDLLHSVNHLISLSRPDSDFIHRWHKTYLRTFEMIKNNTQKRFLSTLGSGLAVLGLPSMAKTHTRVAEGIASGRPVITCRIPNRPLNDRLYHDGSEILIYDPDDAEGIVRKYRMLKQDPDLAGRISRAARLKLLEFHSTEKRAGQLLRWIETGKEPFYVQPS